MHSSCHAKRSVSNLSDYSTKVDAEKPCTNLAAATATLDVPEMVEERLHECSDKGLQSASAKEVVTKQKQCQSRPTQCKRHPRNRAGHNSYGNSSPFTGKVQHCGATSNFGKHWTASTAESSRLYSSSKATHTPATAYQLHAKNMQCNLMTTNIHWNLALMKLSKKGMKCNAVT